MRFLKTEALVFLFNQCALAVNVNVQKTSRFLLHLIIYQNYSLMRFKISYNLSHKHQHLKSFRYRTKSELALKKKKHVRHYKKEKLHFYCELAKNLEAAKKNNLTIIYVFANGRPTQMLTKIVLTREDMFNWDRSLEHISKAIDMPEGIYQ